MAANRKTAAQVEIRRVISRRIVAESHAVRNRRISSSAMRRRLRI